MSNSSSGSKSKTYLTFGRIGLFYFFGLSIFFISAFTIITLQVSVKERVQIPALVGKLYLEEHNRLQKLGIKVEIEKNSSLDYPYGYILGQSVPPGLMLAQGSGIRLVVNFSKAIVQVPELVGLKLRIAQKMLSRIPAGGQTYSLKLGKVTKVESSSPAGEVLAQYPPANTPVIPDQVVELLVSSGKSKAQRLNAFSKIGNVDLFLRAAYEHQIPVSASSQSGPENLRDRLARDSSRAIASNRRTTRSKAAISASFNEAASDDDVESELRPYRYRWQSYQSLGLEPAEVTMVRLKRGSKYTQSKKLEYQDIDAFAYLSQASQVPILARPGTEYLFFEGYLLKSVVPGYQVKQSEKFVRYLFPKETSNKAMPKPVKVIKI